MLVIGTLGYGHYRLSERPDEKVSYKATRAVIVQGNIDQSLKWDPAYQAKTLETYLRLTRENDEFLPELIVWPETAVPFFFQDNVELSTEVVSMANESGAAMVFGSPAYKKTPGTINYYNRAYLISPDGRPPQHYDKVHLVPFGEYVPFKKLLSFVNRLVSAAGDFAEGEKIVPLNHEHLSIGVLICFEAIFPEIARIHTQRGANILVNITNDAWFGNTSAPYQHLAMAVFRAVENRRPLIRSANTGFSAFIGPQGKIIARGDLFCEETLKESMDISNSASTYYTRFGDIFALSMLIFSLIKISSLLWKRKISGRLSKK
jgi:apolipoprotein N-acyltransferase